MLQLGIDVTNAALMLATQPPAAPVLAGVPAISGTPVAGAVLTAVPAPVSGTPTPVRTWAWRRAGTPIAGATAATYTLAGADVGQTITVVQTETNAQGTASAQSAATAPVGAAPVAPSITGLPTIAGSQREGQTLTAAPASAAGTPVPVRSWAWRRAGTPISGATSASYLLVAADVGQTLTVVQTETNSQGTASAQSAPTGAIAPPAPIIGTVTFTPGAAGTPASLAMSYTGNVTGYRVYIATGTAPLTVSAAQLHAGSGGTSTLQFANFAVGTNIDVTGLTAVSEAATRIALCLISTDGSSASNIVTVTVSGLDFTAPVLSSGTTNTAGTQVTLTLSESLFGTAAAANWSVARNGAAQTPTAVSIAGATVQLTLGTAVTNGQTVTVSYAGGDLEDGAGNALAAITGAAVTNAVPSSTGFEAPVAYEQATTIRSGSATPAQTTSAVFASAGTWLVQLASMHDNAANSAFTLSGAAVTSAVLLTDSSAAKLGRVGTFAYWVTTSGASNLTVTETANVQSFIRRIVVQKANGLTNTGAIVGSSQGLSISFSATLAAVPAGRHVSAVAANRGVVMTDHAYSGSFAGTDEVYYGFATTFDNFSVSTASRAAASTGTFTSTVTFSPVGGHSVMSAVALAPV